MRTRRLAGQEVPIIGQGTYGMNHDDHAAAIAALRRGVELGLTHIDTAELYGSGDVEELVREAIAGVRERVYLVSKVLPSNASRQGTIISCEHSLRRLGTDHLDLYLLHWAGPHPPEDTLAAFEQLVREGKILAYGVSNFDVKALEAAWALAGEQLACNQVCYHLGARYIERAVLPWCQAHGVALVGYSPFGQRSFPAGGAGLAALRKIARSRGVTPRQVALAFLLREEGSFTIPKSSVVAHVEENAAAAGLVLSAEEIAAIDAVFPLGRDRGLPYL